MVTKAQELPGFTATVDEVIYMDSLETPPDRPYAFVYFITISNKSKVPITVKGRKWVIESKNREKLIVEGDGVVGQTPVPPSRRGVFLQQLPCRRHGQRRHRIVPGAH